MNTVLTSREAILAVSRQLIKERGWTAINIRSVASAGNISIGSIYNYFSSKTELITATIESVWFDVFHVQDGEEPPSDFSSCMEWFYNRIKSGAEKYPNFVNSHAMSFIATEKAAGKHQMAQIWTHIQQKLLIVLKNDARVRSDAFSGCFTQEKFIEFIFSILLFALMKKDYDSHALIQMIERLIY